VSEPILDSACIVPLVRKCVPTGVPQHVGVNLEGEAGALANALDQPINGIGGEWAAPLRLEHIAARGLALEFAKRAQLVAADRVRGWLAILGTADVQRGGASEFDLRPLQVADLDGPQTVPIGDEDQCGVPQAVCVCVCVSRQRACDGGHLAALHFSAWARPLCILEGAQIRHHGCRPEARHPRRRAT
jgi:hypothetical protein